MSSTTARHLRSLLSSESDRLTNLSEHWQDILEHSEGIPEEIDGQIRALIGQARLLVNDKFQQYTSLLDSYETGNPDVPMKMTVSDLEGLWDVIYIQVEDIVKKCHALYILKRNNWVEPVSAPTERVPLASISNSNQGRTISKITIRKKDHSAGARRRLAEAKLRMQQLQAAVVNGSDTAIPSTSGQSSPSSSMEENRKQEEDDADDLES